MSPAAIANTAVEESFAFVIVGRKRLGCRAFMEHPLTYGKGLTMSVIRSSVVLLLSGLLAVHASAQTDNSLPLDIDGPITQALSSPEARDAVETECLDKIAANADWPEFYRAVRILAVIGTAKSVAPLATLLQQEEKSHLARIALEAMPYPEVDAAFIEAVKTAPRKSQMGIISAIAARKDKNAVPVLLGLMAPDDRQMLEGVTLALGKIGGEEAAEILESLLKAGDKSVEYAAAEALLVLSEGLTQEGRGRDASKYYLKFVEPSWPENVRSGAFLGLLRALPGQAPEAVIQAIKSDDALLRAVGIAAVSSLPGEGVAARFTSELASLPPEIHVPLLESLAMRSETMDPAFLYGLLKDPREEMRVAVMKAIAGRCDNSAINPLLAVLNDDVKRQERQAVVETLRRLRGDAVDSDLTALLATSPVTQRPEVIEALVQRGALSSVDAFFTQLSEEPVRPAAFRAIGILAGPERLDDLISALTALSGDSGREDAEGAVIALIRKSAGGDAQIAVSKAVYGDLPGGQYVDVTPTLRSKIEQGALPVQVSNAVFGEPAPGKVKKLEVDYTINGVAVKSVVQEGGNFDLAAQAVSSEIIAKLAAPLSGTPTGEARASLFRVLSRVGGEQAFALVKGQLTNETQEVRDAAIRALSSWPDTIAAADLVDIFAGATDSSHRGLALRGSVRLLKMGALPGTDTASLYEILMKKAVTAEEKRLVLSGLAELAEPSAVALVHPLLTDAEVKEEAALALDRIKAGLGEEAFNKAMAELPSKESADAPPVVDDNFVPIFNGTSLEGWSGDPALWRVEEGAIIGETKADNALKYNTFLIWEEDEPGDFDVKFRYRLESDWVNSGLQIRSERFDTYRVRGYQADISTEDWITGICYEEGGRGILAKRGQKVVLGPEGPVETKQFGDENALKDYIYPGDWNEYEVHVRGNQFYSRINGHKMHEVMDDSSKARRKGIIAFQLHAGPPMKIRITDVMIKRVAPQNSN